MNANQRKILAEIVGNMAIVWYAATVVPILLLSIKSINFQHLINFLAGVIMTIAHIKVSLEIAK